MRVGLVLALIDRSINEASFGMGFGKAYVWGGGVTGSTAGAKGAVSSGDGDGKGNGSGVDDDGSATDADACSSTDEG